MQLYAKNPALNYRVFRHCQPGMRGCVTKSLKTLIGRRGLFWLDVVHHEDWDQDR